MKLNTFLHRNLKFSKQAFTMVELMSTLLIIGLLFTIAIASYNSYVSRARMAEGYQLMDANTKNQVTYFAFHKEFRYASDNPDPSSQGLPVSKSPFLTTPSWNDLGYPVTATTPVSFVSMIVPGKVDASGTETVVTLSSGTAQTTTQNLLFNHAFTFQPLTNSSGNKCDAFSSGSFFSVTGKTDYKWVVIIEVANLKQDNTSIDKCTWMYRVIDTNDRGEVSTNGVAILNRGE